MTYELMLGMQKIPLKKQAIETDEALALEALALVQERIVVQEKIFGRDQIASQEGTQKALLGALFDLAEEYLRAKRRVLDYQQQIEADVHSLVQLVEKELQSKED